MGGDSLVLCCAVEHHSHTQERAGERERGLPGLSTINTLCVASSIHFYMQW